MASAGRSQLLSFMDELIPTIRTALCDRYIVTFLILLLIITFVWFLLYVLCFINFYYSMVEVREAAGAAFSTLYKVHLLPFISKYFYK